MEQLVLGGIWYAVLVASLTLHEASHAWAARRGGDATAYLGGQVSLDPRPHLRREPVGTVFVPLLSFAFFGFMIGWASTPYDRRWAHAHPRRAAWMSLAGPAANLGLVVLAGLVVRVGLAAGAFQAPEVIRFTQVVAAGGGGVAAAAASFVSILFTLNLLLCIFNLIPLPPLDGAGVLALLVPVAVARRLQEWLLHPQVSMLGLLLAWMLVGRVFGAAHLLAVNLLYPEVHYG